MGSESMSIIKAVEQAQSGSIHQNAYGDGLAADEMVKKVYLGQDFELKKKKNF